MCYKKLFAYTIQAFQDLKDLTGGKLQYVHIKVGIRMAKKIILILDKWFLHWIHCSLVKLTVIV